MATTAAQRADINHINDHPPRFCTSHQSFAPVAGGVWLKKGHIRRWVCANCRARRNEARANRAAA